MTVRFDFNEYKKLTVHCIYKRSEQENSMYLLNYTDQQKLVEYESNDEIEPSRARFSSRLEK